VTTADKIVNFADKPEIPADKPVNLADKVRILADKDLNSAEVRKNLYNNLIIHQEKPLFCDYFSYFIEFRGDFTNLAD
jgi:hypothetical protein